jgi:hypothetical protein
MTSSRRSPRPSPGLLASQVPAELWLDGPIMNICAVTDLALESSKEVVLFSLGGLPRLARGEAEAKRKKARSTVKPLENTLVMTSSERRDTMLNAENAHADFSFPPRAAAVVDRKRREGVAPAFLPTNFVLVGMTVRGGIKHGTVRGESTPRTRPASTFTLKTDMDSSKRTKPGRVHRGIAAEPPRPGLPLEGRTLREGQGGPR